MRGAVLSWRRHPLERSRAGLFGAHALRRQVAVLGNFTGSRALADQSLA